MVERVIFARDSEIRTMASNWLSREQYSVHIQDTLLKGEPNGDGDGTSFVVILFNLLHLFSQADKMAAKHFLSFA